MPNFDIDSYLRGREVADNKLQQVMDASRQKMDSLSAINPAAKMASSSWSEKLGLNPQGFAANRVNDVASVVSGTARLAGDLASLPVSAYGAAVTQPLNENDISAYNRTQTNTALPQDAARLQRTPTPGFPSVLDRINTSNEQRGNARAINDFFNLESIVDPRNREGLTQDLEKNFKPTWAKATQGWEAGKHGEVVSAVGSLIASAGAAVLSNPSGVREYALENLPNMFVGLFGRGGRAAMAASNVGYAMDTFQEGMQNFVKENGGQLPSIQQQTEMATEAATLALSEQVGDAVGLGATKLIGNASKDTARAGFKNAMRGVGKAAGEGLLTEAPTEAYQTYMEGEITGKPATAQDVYTGAVIGGASGASLAGGGRAIAEMTGSTPEAVTRRNDEVNTMAAAAKTFTEAAASNDTSAYMDPAVESYNPARAVGVLHRNSQLPTTTPEAKQENLVKARQIVNDLEDRAVDGDELVAMAKEPAPAQEARRVEVASLKTEVSALDAADATNTDAIAALNTRIALAETVLGLAADPVALRRQATENTATARHLDGAYKAQTQLSKLVNPPASVAEVAAQVAASDAQVDPTDTAAVTSARSSAETVINLSMANTSNLSGQQATRLADNSSNFYTEGQRTYLRNFAEARTQETTLQTLGGVSMDVLTGSTKRNMVGITQHRQSIGDALDSGNRNTADRRMGMLASFAADHASKAAIAAASIGNARQGQPVQVIKENGQWVVSPTVLNNSVMASNSWMTINTGSQKYVAAVRAESVALNAALTEMQSAYAVKFGSASPTATNATVVPTSTVSEAVAPTVAGNTSIAAETVTPETVVVASAPATTAVVEPTSTVEATQAKAVTPSVVAAEGTVANAVEPTVTEQATEAVVAPVEVGNLTALTAKSAEGTAYNLRNLLADFFVQKTDNPRNATKRPLVEVKNFLSQLAAGTVSAFDFLKSTDLAKLTETQETLVQTFRKKAAEWQGLYQPELRRKNREDFNYTDLMQFLIQETGVSGQQALDLEENVKTAMSYAAFSWITDQAGRDAANTDAEINLILLRDEDHSISTVERNALGLVGTRENVVRNALGQKAIQALGMEALTKAPADLMARLESALGGHIEKMLLSAGVGLLKRSSVPAAEMDAMTGKESGPNVLFQFLALPRDEAGTPVLAAALILEASKGTQGVLDKLFSVEPTLKEPSLTAPKLRQRTTKNTLMGIPSMLRKIVQRQNNQENFIRQDHWSLLNMLSPEVAQSMAGTEVVNNQVTHKANRKGLKAKNDGLIREYQRFMDYVGGVLVKIDGDLSMPIFFEHSIWKPQRVGIATNVINPQTSKMQRFLMFRKEWESQVSFDNEAQMQNFQLRVMEGLGVKTDKQSNETSLGLYEDLVTEPVIEAAVEVLQRTVLQGNEMSEADQQTLLLGVQRGGQNFHSLDALMAMAHEMNAISNGAESFTVQMMGEIDGVTNGPMFSHLLLGAAESVADLFGLLNKGGFYQLGSEHTQYNQWRGQEGNTDLYETTTKHVAESLAEWSQQKPELQPFFNAVSFFTGALVKDDRVTKAGRDIIKTPLTAMVFGSSVNSALDSMADKFVESIYGQIEDLSSGAKPVDRIKLIESLNRLLVGQAKIPTTTTVAQLMDMELNKFQVAAVKKAFKDSMGLAVKATMQQDFGQFIQRRDAFNRAAQMSFELYNAAYLGMREQFIKDSPDIAKDKNGKALHALSADQEAQLRTQLEALVPLMHSPMSKASDDLSSGLQVARADRTLSENEAYKSDIQFNTPVENTGKRPRSMSATGFETVQSGPGVSVFPISTHSTDSAISHMAAFLGAVLNIHDAHGTGLATFQQTAQNLNKATWDVMLETSPAAEIYATLSRTLQGLDALLKTENVPPAVMTNLVKAVETMAAKVEADPRTFLATTVNFTQALATQADSMKLQAMSQMAFIDQYALEGGNYEVTDADRAEATKRLEALVLEVSPEVQSSLDAIMALMKIQSATNAAQADMSAAERLEQEDSLEDSDVLGIRPVLAMQLIEGAIAEPGMPETKRTQLRAVLAAMVGGAMSLKQAVLSTLTGPFEAAGMVQMLHKRERALKQNYWGAVGKPTLFNDPTLVEFFETNPDVNAKTVLNMVLAKLNDGPQNNGTKFNKKILAAINKLVDPNLRIRYVTPATAPNLVLDKAADKSRGWYVSTATAEEIYVLSPDFKDSGLTDETLVHELVHASLARVIETELAKLKANPKYTSDALSLVQELETLLTEAKRFTADNGLTQYGAALTNVHELLSWGLTNQDFQTNVLSRISVPSKAKGNPLVAGMKAFIDSITGLLFGSKGNQLEQDSNGMSVLLANVSGLFFEAANTRAAQQKLVTDRAQANFVAGQVGSMGSTGNPVNTYSTHQLYNALGPLGIGKPFDTHMRTVLTNIVEKLHGPFGSFKASLMQNQTISAIDVFGKALMTGQAPFASKALASGLPFTDQSAYVMDQVEATVRAALDGNEAVTSAVYSEMGKLFVETRGRLSAKDFHPGDWSLATPQEVLNAQETYDFIFKMDPANGGRQEHVARFAAMGLAHEGFNKLLQVPTSRAPATMQDKTVSGMLNRLFNQILEWFNGKLTHTTAGQFADEKLTALVEQLVDIEGKQKSIVRNRGKTIDRMGLVEDRIKDAATAARAKVSQFAESDFFKKSKSGYVRAAGSVTSVIANDRVLILLEGIKQMRDKTFKDKLGVAGGILNDVLGPKPTAAALLRQTKKGEGDRKDLIVNTSRGILGSFANAGKDMSRATKAAMSAVMLRTGAHVLLEGRTMAEMQTLLSDPAVLDAEIAKLEAQLNGYSPRIKNQFTTQSKMLAYYLTTGRAKEEGMLMNASNISLMYGTGLQGTLTPANSLQAAAVLDPLISLYALSYTKAEQRSAVAQLMRDENNRADLGNGVEMALLTHKALEADAKARLFDGSEALMVKGYTPETYNHHTEVKVAGPEDGQILLDLGYKRGAQVEPDLRDPDQGTKHIYVLKDGGLMPWLSGIFSMTGMRAKGTRVSGLGMQTRARTTYAMNPNFDPRKVKGNFMVPLLNGSGETVGQHYLMHEDTKDNVLERNNNFEELLGNLAGSTYDKESSVEHNRKAIQALKDQHAEEVAELPDAYIEVGPNSPDPELREIYKMLPQSSKQNIRDIWGSEAMQVRKDSLDINFGYRKLSLSTAFAKDAEQRDTMDKIMVGFVEGLLENYGNSMAILRPDQADKYKNFKKRGSVIVRRGERVWQAVVQEMKDIIVVKTGIVAMGNLFSNHTLLMLSGVSNAEILKHSQVAIKGANDFKRDSAALSKLQSQVNIGYVTGDLRETENEIARLQDALQRNPVRPLIESGLMPTIVEDLVADDDIYSYQSEFVRRTESLTNKLNPKVKQLARNVYMTHDTQAYKFFATATQLGDFVARYTLYMHNTTKDSNPMSHEAAVADASDAFINYDIPMQRALQYTDDMGITMFTKYFLRVQRVLMKRAKENPGRMMAGLVLNNYLGLSQTVLDSSFLTRIGNDPFKAGALNYVGTLDQLATVKAGVSVFK